MDTETQVQSEGVADSPAPDVSAADSAPATPKDTHQSRRETIAAAAEAASKPKEGAEALPKRATPPKDAESGRFLRGVKPGGRAARQGEGAAPGAPTPAAAAGSQTVAPPAQSAQPDFSKAPQSWKAEAKEHWAKLPPEVQREAFRREAEFTQAMQKAAASQRSAEPIEAVLRPFRPTIDAIGAAPDAVVKNALTSWYHLYTAPPFGKAQMVANIIRQFGVDEGQLVAALQGQQPPAGQAQQQFDPNQLLAQAEQRMEQRINARQQAVVTQKAEADIAAFDASDEHEFKTDQDVRNLMADLLEVAGRRGVRLTPQDAYRQAEQLNPGTARILKQRQDAERAKAQNASTQRARAASVSLKSQPSGVTRTQGPKVRRDMIAALVDEHL